MTTTNFTNSQMPNASTTEKWAIIIATNSDVSTWTNETKAVNSKQVKDNYWTTFISTWSSTWVNWTTITLTHWLWRTPRFIRLRAISNIDGLEANALFWWEWYYNWTTYSCQVFQRMWNPRYQTRVFTDRIWHIKSDSNTWTDTMTKITVSTFNSTEVVLTNTVSSWSAESYTYLVYIE